MALRALLYFLRRLSNGSRRVFGVAHVSHVCDAGFVCLLLGFCCSSRRALGSFVHVHHSTSYLGDVLYLVVFRNWLLTAP